MRDWRNRASGYRPSTRVTRVLPGRKFENDDPKNVLKQKRKSEANVLIILSFLRDFIPALMYEWEEQTCMHIT